MPYKSDKQRGWMHVHRPDIAKKWDKEMSSGFAGSGTRQVGEAISPIEKEYGDEKNRLTTSTLDAAEKEIERRMKKENK